jgi:hypothetical protein
MVELLFQAFSTIDISDHYRQGILELERHWLTKHWWVRIFTTVLGIVFTNIYLIRRHEYREDLHLNPERQPMPEFVDYLGKLCYQLIFNPLVPDAPAGQRRGRGVGPFRADDDGIQAPAVGVNDRFFYKS